MQVSPPLAFCSPIYRHSHDFFKLLVFGWFSFALSIFSYLFKLFSLLSLFSLKFLGRVSVHLTGLWDTWIPIWSLIGICLKFLQGVFVSENTLCACQPPGLVLVVPEISFCSCMPLGCRNCYFFVSFLHPHHPDLSMPCWEKLLGRNPVRLSENHLPRHTAHRQLFCFRTMLCIFPPWAFLGDENRVPTVPNLTTRLWPLLREIQSQLSFL